MGNFKKHVLMAVMTSFVFMILTAAMAMSAWGEDCISYDPSTLKIKRTSGGWLLTGSISRIPIFKTSKDAQLAKAIAQQHTSLCFINKNNSHLNKFGYIEWQGDSGINTPQVKEDCISYNPSNLNIDKIVNNNKTQFIVTDGKVTIDTFDSNTDADFVLDIAKHYNSYCFIGRNKTGQYTIRYWVNNPIIIGTLPVPVGTVITPSLPDYSKPKLMGGTTNKPLELIGMVTSMTRTPSEENQHYNQGLPVFDVHPNEITSDGKNLYIVEDTSGTFNTSKTYKIHKLVISSHEISTFAICQGGYGHITTDGKYLYATEEYDTTDNLKKKTIKKIDLLNSSNSSYIRDDLNSSGTNYNAITTDGTFLYAIDNQPNQLDVPPKGLAYGTIKKIKIDGGKVETILGMNKDVPTLTRITIVGDMLYFTAGRAIYKTSININAGSPPVVAGGINYGASDSVSPTKALFTNPVGITTDGVYLYVADQGNHKIRKINILSGEVSSLTGTPDTSMPARPNTEVEPIKAKDALFVDGPNFITTDGSNLYISDSSDNKIRKIE